jgi:hypothetical protein
MSTREVIEALLTGTEQAFEVNLQRLYPEVGDQEVQRWGRAIRRAICAALLFGGVWRRRSRQTPLLLLGETLS